MAKEVADIIEELKQVGAMLPEDLDRTECLAAQDILRDELRIAESAYHTAGIKAVKEKNWSAAADEFHKFSAAVERLLLDWSSQCACAKKGDIVQGIQYGIASSENNVDLSNLNVIWQDIIAALNRRGILTSEEADRLINEVRW